MAAALHTEARLGITGTPKPQIEFLTVYFTRFLSAPPSLRPSIPLSILQIDDLFPCQLFSWFCHPTGLKQEARTRRRGVGEAHDGDERQQQQQRLPANKKID